MSFTGNGHVQPAERPDPAVELPEPDEHEQDDERRPDLGHERHDPVPGGTPRCHNGHARYLTRLYESRRCRSIPSRTVAELEELRELTGDENGAQRVAWTDTWETARGWLRGKLAGTGAREEIDEAGNQWFTLGEGASGPS